MPLFILRFTLNIILLTAALFVTGPERTFAILADDTLRTAKTHFQSSLGFTFLAGREPIGFAERMITIDSRSELTRSVVSGRTNSEIKIRHELGYTGIADSVWIKNNDRLRTNYDLRSGTGPAQHRFRIEFETGIFNDYEALIDPANGRSYSEISASFLNPASLETGYGFSIKPTPFYELGFSLSTAKIRTFPIYKYQISPNGIEIAKLNRAAVIFNYGFSIQLIYLRSLSEKVEISGNGNLFIRGLKKEELEGEASIQMILHLTKWLQIRMFSRIEYDSSVGQKARYRTEVLTGFYYENNK